VLCQPGWQNDISTILNTASGDDSTVYRFDLCSHSGPVSDQQRALFSLLCTLEDRICVSNTLSAITDRIIIFMVCMPRALSFSIRRFWGTMDYARRTTLEGGPNSALLFTFGCSRLAGHEKIGNRRYCTPNVSLSSATVDQGI